MIINVSERYHNHDTRNNSQRYLDVRKYCSSIVLESQLSRALAAAPLEPTAMLHEPMPVALFKQFKLEGLKTEAWKVPPAAERAAVATMSLAPLLGSSANATMTTTATTAAESAVLHDSGANSTSKLYAALC